MFSMSQGITVGTTGYSQADQAAAGRKPRQEEKMTCLPVTIRSIETAVAQSADAGGEVKFFGSQPGMLILVALVETVTKSGTACEMSLNDSTGRIKARYYITDESKDTEAFVPGRYVSLFGTARLAPELHFSVTGGRLVTSGDEVSYHMIESAHAALKLQKGRIDPTTPSPTKKPTTAVTSASPGGSNFDGSAPMEVTPEKTSAFPTPATGASPSTGGAATASTAKPALHGDELKSALLAFLQKESPSRGEEGVAINEICTFGAPAAEKEVREILELLVGEGEVFVTVDDDHFSTNV